MWKRVLLALGHRGLASPLCQRLSAASHASAVPGGWRAVQFSCGLHDVVEFWFENAAMPELLTPEMTAEYLASTHDNQAGPAPDLSREAS